MSQSSKNIKIVLFATLVFGAACIWYLLWQTEHRQLLTVAFLDVGQGDAIFIEAPNGNQVIVDGGPDGSILAELGRVMPFYDKHIDMLLVTNPDLDHYGGFIDVMEQYAVAAILLPGTHSETPTYAAFAGTIQEHHIPSLVVAQGMRFVLDAKREIFLDILFPNQDVSKWKSNDGSTIAKLTYGTASILLTGDSTMRTEQIVMRDFMPEVLHADILKVGHHGSKTSTSEAFLKAVAPTTAIISAGRDNRYGLPKQEILDRLKNGNILTLITAAEGTIVVRSDGKSFWRTDE